MPSCPPYTPHLFLLLVLNPPPRIHRQEGVCVCVLTVGEKASGLEEGWKQGSLEEYNYPSESHSTPVPGNAGEPSAPNSLGLEGRSTTDHFSVLSWTWKQPQGKSCPTLRV